MNKTKKLLRLLAGLGEEVTVRDVTEVRLDDGCVRIDITVDHGIYIRPCDKCGSKRVIRHDRQNYFAWHILLGRRQPTKILLKRQRFKCSSCGATLIEKLPWLYGDIHMTMPLADCIKEDLHSLMTKETIAHNNRVSVHFVDVILKDLTPPLPDHLPEVLCLDETFSEVEEDLGEKTQWVKFVTNLSDGKTGELLDIIPYRQKRKLIKYFKDNFSYDERCKVQHLCCDGADFYISLAKVCFPNADVCLDNFHVTKYIQHGVFSVRVKQQNYLLSKSNTRNDKHFKEYVVLKHLSHKLVTSIYNHYSYWGDRSGEHAALIMHHLSICPELKDAYAMLQYFYEIFHSNYDFRSKVEDLGIWMSVFGRSTSDPIAATVKTVRDHLPYILNSWKNGYSNAVCEGNNCFIQTIKNISFGIHSFEYFRTRTMLIVGRPGVARAIQKDIDDNLTLDSFFFDVFPSLDEYVLAYDWTQPFVDHSLKEV